jgi:hypothetical protein
VTTELGDRRHARTPCVAGAPKTRSRASLNLARAAVASFIVGTLWLSLAASAITDPTAPADDQEIQIPAEETTTVPVEDESTDTTEETGTTTTTEPGESSTERPPTVDVSWWQWLLGGALVIGAGAVIRKASSRPPDPATIELDAQSLLAHYQEVAVTIAGATPSQEGYGYELGVLDTIAPRLDDLIEATQSASQRGLLTAVRSRTREAVDAIRATAPDRGALSAQLLVHQAGAAMERAIRRARDEF